MRSRTQMRDSPRHSKLGKEQGLEIEPGGIFGHGPRCALLFPARRVGGLTERLADQFTLGAFGLDSGTDYRFVNGRQMTGTFNHSCFWKADVSLLTDLLQNVAHGGTSPLG